MLVRTIDILLFLVVAHCRWKRGIFFAKGEFKLYCAAVKSDVKETIETPNAACQKGSTDKHTGLNSRRTMEGDV